jgi:hypothetical protein
MKRTSAKIAVLIVCSLALLATFIFPNLFQHYTTLSSYQETGLSYDSTVPLSKIYRHRENSGADIKSFNLSMSLRPTSVAHFDNAFQTAPMNSGLRLELAKPHVLALIAAAQNAQGFIAYVISTTFTLNTWHTFDVALDPEKHITIDFDGQQVFNQKDPTLAYSISDIAIGTGLSELRPFVGQIKDASFSYTFYELNSGAGAMLALRGALLAGLLISLFLLGSSAPSNELAGASNTSEAT